MAINDSGTRNQYTATAGQTVFPYTFEIFDKNDIKVQQKVYLTGVTTTLTEGTHYTVSGVDNDAGGDVTLITGAAVSDTITLSRDMALERLTDYQNSGDFLAAEVNSEQDRQWAAIQQIDSKSSIGIRPTIDDPILNSTNTELAAPATRAGKALGFNPDGTLAYLSSAVPNGDFTHVSTVAAMQALTGLTAGTDVIQTAEFSTGNGGGGVYDVVLTTSVTPNGYNIIQGVADTDISFVLRKDPEGYKFSQLGLDPTGATDNTSDFNSIMSTIVSDGDDIWFTSGTYEITGGLVSSKSNINIKSYGYVKLKHPVEGTSGRSVTRKNIELNSCTNCQVHGIDFEGEHINAAGGDNAVQSGLAFVSSNDCVAYNCYAEDLQRGFIDQGGTNNQFLFCASKTTYNGFLSTTLSTFTRFSHCDAEDSYYGAQFGPTSATGYGFLFDASTDGEAISCTSTKSGSDCFRSSGAECSRTRFVNCRSYSPRRNAFSHRQSTSVDCETINCSAYNIGDASFWNGASGSYTESSTQARAHYLDSPGAMVRGGVIKNLITDESTATANNMFEMFYINQDDIHVEGVRGYGYVDGDAFSITSSADNGKLLNNTIEMQVLASSTANYVFDVGAGSGHEISGNRATGGNDGYLILASDCLITDNKAENCARHGFNIASSDSLHDGNRAVNVGLQTTGAGHYFNASNITAGTNISVDRQGTPTMNYAAWITSSATGLEVGRVINRSTVSSLRDDLGVYGEFGTATSSASETAANIADIAATINTQDKFAGKKIWDSTNNRELRASGSTAGSVWHVVDGSASVTPV